MIQFYSSKEKPYGAFSNFARYPIVVDGLTWANSEACFQSRKFLDPELQERVRLAPTPMEAANIGRDRSLPLRPDWDQIKNKVMYRAVMAKFTQHSDLLMLLLGTDAEHLVEHTTNDSYWADGGDGSGKNVLGLLLMVVRNQLRQMV
jgi:hypothetical protein